MKYLIFIFCLCSFSSFAQRIGTTNSLVHIPGKFRVPLDTVDAPNGSVAFLNNIFYGRVNDIWVAFASGGAGVSNFFDLLDVDSTGTRDGYLPYYDAASGHILFQSIGSNTFSGNTFYQFQDSTNTPPVSFPANAVDTLYYCVGGGGTGIFSGNNYKIAMYVNEVFDSFITPALNDWGFVLTGAAKNTWHQYDGATWPRRNDFSWSTTGNKGGGYFGSTDNSNVSMGFNNTNRIILQGNGTRFTQMSGTNKGIAYFAQTGLIQRREPVASTDTTNNKPVAWAADGTIYRMSYWPGSGGGTTPTWEQTLVATGGQTLLTDHTITATGLRWLWNLKNYDIEATDSIHEGTGNDWGVVAGGTARITAATLIAKAATATFGASSAAMFTVNTGTDSLGWSMHGNKIFEKRIASGTGLFVRVASDSSLVYSTTVDAATELTNKVPTGNGGTNLNTYTTGDILYASATNVLSKLAIGSTNQQLTVVGGIPAWATATNYWARQQYGALASTNILQQATLTDTVALFSGLAALRAKFNVSGNANITGSLQVGGNAAMNATYELDVANDIRAQGTLEVDDKASINTFGAAVAGQALTVGLSNVANGGGVFIGTNQVGAAGMVYGVRITPTINQLVTTTGVGFTGVSVAMGQSNAGTPVSASWVSFSADPLVSSTNSTNIVNYNGFRASANHSSGTQKFTTYYAFHDTGYIATSGTQPLTTGNYYSFRADSVWGTRVGGTIYHFYDANNAAKGIVNVFESKSAFGNSTSPTSYLQTTSFAMGYVAKSADYTATIDDHTIDITAATKTITLPTAVGITGREYTVKLTASGTTGTVATTSSQTIDGSTTYSLSAQYKYVTVQSDGANWIIIANN